MIYETERDLREEKSIKSYIESKKQIKLVKTAKFTKWDFWVTDKENNLTALMEVKSRKSASIQYPTFYISADKLANILYLKQFFGKKQLVKNEEVDLLIVVKFIDKIMYYKHNPSIKYKLTLSGNKTRKPEMVAHIPINLFKEI